MKTSKYPCSLCGILPILMVIFSGSVVLIGILSENELNKRENCDINNYYVDMGNCEELREAYNCCYKNSAGIEEKNECNNKYIYLISERCNP